MLKGYEYNDPDYSPTLQVLPIDGRWSAVISEPLDYSVVRSFDTQAEALAFVDGIMIAQRARQALLDLTGREAA